ncbi:hypothetical protein F558DRAFT_04641 [Streptomyces sp. AmelKG-A3]|nr:hypothetical protein GA0115247_103626 [Streptomyces sp. PalvLS-984]SDD69994.1 hypothetical protein F558DRAFT_04641 [Streptomyces sp. AmelKG-A3]
MTGRILLPDGGAERATPHPARASLTATTLRKGDG